MRPTLPPAIVFALVFLACRSAHAYPHWQFSSGVTRCSSCHVSPSGGGLLSSFGRDQAGEELSSFAGDGAFLHGVGRSMPSWMAFGGDLRGAVVVNDVQDPGGPRAAVFPMQAEVSMRLSIGGGLSIFGSVGLRGSVRKPDSLVPHQNYQPIDASRIVSREHFLMWRRASRGPYVKLGRFYAPFGLRLPEHIFYIRRDLGFNLMEESYNLSIGHVGERSELHVTAFAPDEFRHMGGTEWGGAAFYERHLFGGTGALGAQTKLAFGVGVTRWIVGTVAKKYVAGARTLFLAEADVVYNRFPMAVGSTVQVVGLVGASWLPAPSTIVSLYAEHEQTDLRVRNSSRDAASLQLTWFPYAHVELQVLGRLQFPAGGETAKTLLMQVHYFL